MGIPSGVVVLREPPCPASFRKDRDLVPTDLAADEIQQGADDGGRAHIEGHPKKSIAGVARLQSHQMLTTERRRQAAILRPGYSGEGPQGRRDNFEAVPGYSQGLA